MYFTVKTKSVVLGSINYDIVAKVNNLPVKGETITGLSVDKFVGGKGSNQAVQMALLGLETHFIGRVGNDDQGQAVRKALADTGVDVRYLYTSENLGTGCAIIVVDSRGDNTLVYVPGANKDLTIGLINNARELIDNADVLVTQTEINIDAMSYGLSLAKKAGVTTVLTPGPAVPLDDEIFPMLDFIVPNETESAAYTGISQKGIPESEWNRKNAEWFLRKGVKNVCITLGEKGVYFFNGEVEYSVPVFTVNSVDATAAGDAFIGGLTFGLATKQPLLKCLQTGNACGALATTILGAQNSLHDIDSVQKLLS